MNDIAVRPVRYGLTKDQIEAVQAQCKDIDATTPAGYLKCKSALVKVKTLLNVLDGERKELKANAKAYVDLVDSEARKLRGPLEELEAVLKEKKKAIDDAKAAEKRAKQDAARAAEFEQLRIEREANEKIKAEAEAATRAAEEATRKLEAAQRLAVPVPRVIAFGGAVVGGVSVPLDVDESGAMRPNLENLNDALSSVPSHAHGHSVCPTCGRPF